MDTRIRRVACTLVLGALLVAATAAATPAPASPSAPGFLTGPSSEKPLTIVVGYLKQHLAAYGLQPGDVDDVVAIKVVKGDDSGVTYVYLQQRHDGSFERAIERLLVTQRAIGLLDSRLEHRVEASCPRGIDRLDGDGERRIAFVCRGINDELFVAFLDTEGTRRPERAQLPRRRSSE